MTTNANFITRARTTLVVVLILIPLATTAFIKFRPALSEHKEISSLAVLHPRLIGSAEFQYLENDVVKRLHESLADVPELVVRDIPPMDNQFGKVSLAELMKTVDADALLVPTLTIDAGIVQLNLQVFEADTLKVRFNTPYQSSIDNYPNMMKAAGAALKRALKG